MSKPGDATKAARFKVYSKLSELRDAVEELRRAEDAAGLKHGSQSPSACGSGRASLRPRWYTQNVESGPAANLAMTPRNLEAWTSQLARLFHWMRRDGEAEEA